jgi:hypothetical protein
MLFEFLLYCYTDDIAVKLLDPILFPFTDAGLVPPEFKAGIVCPCLVQHMDLYCSLPRVLLTVNRLLLYLCILIG